jgi:ATP-binding cassette subfamily B multidrug efflux pump
LSAVDYETERKILAAVISGVSGQSLLVVSHRVSALESMDNILVLQKGEIIAQGTHQGLLSSSEYYLNTWRLQQQDAKDTQ